MSLNPWLVCGGCCGVWLMGMVFAFRMGISVGRRGMPVIQSPVSFKRRYAPATSTKQSILQEVREQQAQARQREARGE